MASADSASPTVSTAGTSGQQARAAGAAPVAASSPVQGGGGGVRGVKRRAEEDELDVIWRKHFKPAALVSTNEPALVAGQLSPMLLSQAEYVAVTERTLAEAVLAL